MSSFNLIHNLANHFEQAGNHAVFTGTFDPPHRGHMEAIQEGFQELPELTSVVVIPHSWNRNKKPAAVNRRVVWLQQTLEEFIPEAGSKVLICQDPQILADPNKLDVLCKRYQRRVFKIIGSDKMGDGGIQGNPAQVIVTNRSFEISSTMIRDAIRDDQIHSMREKLAAAVLGAIVTEGSYSQSSLK